MRHKKTVDRVYLVWLEWPEKCFCVDSESLKYLKSLVPSGSRVIRAKTRAGFLSALRRATHVITWYFDGEWFKFAGRLKLLATPSAGRELLPSQAPKGVKIHFGGYHGRIIAESAVGFMMAWCRGFFAERQYAALDEKSSPRVWLSSRCRTLAGTKAVIVGYGKIGKAIGELLRSFSCEVIGFTRKNIAELKSSLRDCDWFIMALPSTTGTDNFLDAKLVKALPRKCVVVNVGRGNSVDEASLIEALSTGRISGAYLDVVKDEPISSFRSIGSAGRIEVPANLILMPHSSAFAPEYLRLCFKELKDEQLI